MPLPYFNKAMLQKKDYHVTIIYNHTFKHIINYYLNIYLSGRLSLYRKFTSINNNIWQICVIIIIIILIYYNIFKVLH